MKKRLLLCATILLPGGCFKLPIQIHDHEITIAMKDCAPCFGFVDNENVRSEQAYIHTIAVQYGANSVPVMGKFLYITPQLGECIPYEGVALKTNLLYDVSLTFTLKNQWGKDRDRHRHLYKGSFCLSEDKNAEKVLHHFKIGERPASCPMSSDR